MRKNIVIRPEEDGNDRTSKWCIAAAAVIMLLGAAADKALANDCVPQSVLNWVDQRETTAISPARWQNVRKSLLEQPGGMPLSEMKTIYNRRVSNGWDADHWPPIISAMECLAAQPVVEEEPEPQVVVEEEPELPEPAQVSLPTVYVSNCVGQTKPHLGLILEGERVKCDISVTGNSKAKWLSINYKVENVGTTNYLTSSSSGEREDDIYDTRLREGVITQITVQPQNLPSKDGVGVARVSILPSERTDRPYNVGAPFEFDIRDRQTGPAVQMSGAGCTDFETNISGRVPEDSEKVTCLINSYPAWDEDVTVKYQLSETGTSRVNPSSTVMDTTLAAGKQVHTVGPFTWEDNTAYDQPSQFKFNLALAAAPDANMDVSGNDGYFVHAKDRTSTTVTIFDDDSRRVPDQVARYYEFNKDRAPGYGCNWYRTLVAFNNEPASNPHNCPTDAMTEAEARERGEKWYGWYAIADEIAKYENPLHGNGRVDSDDLRRIHVICSGTRFHEQVGRTNNCIVSMRYVDVPPSSDLPVKVRVTQTGVPRLNETGVFTHIIPSAVRTSAAFGFTWTDDSTVNGTTNVKVEVIRADDGYDSRYIPDPATIGLTSVEEFPIVNEDEGPQTASIVAWNGNECDADHKVKDMSNKLEVCLEVEGGFEEDTQGLVWIESVQGDFIDPTYIGKANGRTITIPGTDPVGEGLEPNPIVRIEYPIMDDPSYQIDSNVVMKFEGVTAGQYTASTSTITIEEPHPEGQIVVHYLHDPNVKQREDKVEFTVHFPEDSPTPVYVQAVMKGYVDDWPKTKTETFRINRNGQKVTLAADNGDQVEIPLEVEWFPVASDYKIAPKSQRYVLQVRDRTTTCVAYTQNSLNDVLEEGSFTKIAQFAITRKSRNSSCPGGRGHGFSEGGGNPKNFNKAVIRVDFHLDKPSPPYNKCDLIDVSVHGYPIREGRRIIPCTLEVRHPRATKIDPDSWTLTGSWGNGWPIRMQSGEDFNTNDERIRFDPTFTFVNSGGGVYDDPNYPAPDFLTIYDNDKADRGVTSEDAYVEFSLSNYEVIDENGPAQPVLRMAAKDGSITNHPLITNLHSIMVEVIPGTAKRNVNYSFGSYVTGVEIASAVVDPGQNSNLLAFTYPAGLRPDSSGNNRAQASIQTLVDDDTLDEYFTIKIQEESLPKGVFLKPGGNSVARITIADGDRYNVRPTSLPLCKVKNVMGTEVVEDTTKCPPKLEVSLFHADPYDAQAVRGAYLIDESSFTSSGGTFNIFLNVKANRDLTANTLQARLEPTKGSPLKYGASNFEIGNHTFTRGETKKLTLPLSEHDFKLGSSYQPDSQFSIRLNSPFAIANNRFVMTFVGDGEVGTSGLGTKKLVRVNPVASAPAYWTIDNDEDNNFVVGVTNPMVEDQILHFPIVVSGTGVTHDDYDLELVSGQDNVHLIDRVGGGHDVIIRGLATNTKFDCAGDSINKSGQACLKYVNKRETVVDNATKYSVNVTIDATEPQYGGTTGMWFSSADGFGIQGREIRPVILTSDAKTVTLQPVGPTSAEEPDSNGASYSTIQSFVDLPFDIVINPGPSRYTFTNAWNEEETKNRITDVRICVDTASSTATYYEDFRIMDAPDSRAQALTGGRAFDKDSQCLKGVLHVRDARTRYYLRVHGDDHDEGTETVGLTIAVEGNNADNVTSSGAVTTWTITNDGPMPREYLARFGHAVAGNLVDAISQRMDANRAAGTEGTLGTVPMVGQTLGEKELLMGASGSVTTETGVSAWGRISQSAFSDTVGTDLHVHSDVTHFTGGADVAYDRWLFGMAVDLSTGDGGYGRDNGVEAELTSLAPYVGYRMDKLKVWGSLGYGAGTVELQSWQNTDVRNDMKADTDFTFAATGLSQDLKEWGNVRLSAFGDGFWQRIESDKTADIESSSSESWTTRGGLRSDVDLNQVSLSPSAALRQDGGDVGVGTSVDVGLDAEYQNRNFSVGVGWSRAFGSDAHHRTLTGTVRWDTLWGSPRMAISDDTTSFGWSWKSRHVDAEYDVEADPEFNSVKAGVRVGF